MVEIKNYRNAGKGSLYTENELRPSPTLSSTVSHRNQEPHSLSPPQVIEESSVETSPDSSVHLAPLRASRHIPSSRSDISNVLGNLGTSTAAYLADQKRSQILSSSGTSPSAKYSLGRYQQASSSASVNARPNFFNRHSTATSISTMSGAVPHSPSQGSYGETPLSRRITGNYFPQSSDIMTNVEQLSGTTTLPKARPAVDARDAIWAELDIMDDIERVADQVAQEGNFFGDGHVVALKELQTSQLELSARMETGEDVIDLMADQAKLWEMYDSEIGIENLGMSKAFNESHFERVQHMVDSVMTHLDKVVVSMKVLEAQSRDLWNEDEEELQL
ncbi:hypothetical protein V1514DRAFT_337686 [Lipomyces japonicus]|uniref:uncharacterized protein n=1 Tax=Lipomyces japonicus TaxID=56871 RepID=UPI0034CD5D04